VLSGIAGLGATALAGCLGGTGTETPAPPGAVTISDEATCDVCGMVISKHPGPTAQVFYADTQPNGHSNPARFDSTWEAFKFDFERDDWTRQSFYVTDYSSVEYQITTDQGQKLISRHVGADTFADATGVTFIAASSVVGTMGEDLLGFSSRDDAESFRADHGGDVVTFDEVTPTLISQLGK
jgi:nitrous oxide reductase accessory protein NosL